MSRSFTSIISAGEIDIDSEKICAIYSIGNSLELLALSPSKKKECIPDCVFCELYFSFVLAYEEILNPEITIHAPFDFQSSLSKILHRLENLDSSEAECWNRDIVDGTGWKEIREISIQALNQIEWEVLLRMRSCLGIEVQEK
jgi:hypothetical protein